MSSSSDSDSTGLPKKKKFRQKFREEWTLTFPWGRAEADNFYCIPCRKTILGGITHIRRHEDTLCHKKNHNKAIGTPKISEAFSESISQSTKADKVAAAEYKCVMFLHEHNLPFLLMEHLPKLLRSVCDDSEVAKDMNISRTKATLITRDCFVPEALTVLKEKISHAVSYSLILDETTDVGIKKSLAVVIRFFDDSKVTDHFFGLLEMKEGSAQELYNTTVQYLKINDVPIEKMIGFAADNASVMMGNRNGVQMLFKKHNPSLFVMGCVCHSFHICSSASAKKLPSELEDFARGIYNFFSNSSKRLQFLKDCQQFLDEKPHKMLRPSQTRWLSLQAVVDRILAHWNSLILVFQDAVLADNLISVSFILEGLRNPIFKAYFHFLSYILDIINRLNLEFQSEKCKIHLLSSRVNSLYKTILKKILKKEYVDNTPLDQILPSNPRNFRDINNCYFGANVAIVLSSSNISKDDILSFKLKGLDFYQELGSQIKMRFCFNNPVLEFCSVFDPKISLSGEIDTIAFNSIKYFPQLIVDIEKLDSEWRLLADCAEVKKYVNLDFESFWLKIFSLKNDLNTYMFPNLTLLLKGIMSLPHSSASAERIFSQLNLVKTKVRNRLNINTSDAILHAKDLLGDQKCFEFMPSQRLLKRKPQYRKEETEN